MKIKLLIIVLMASIYNYGQEISKPDRIVISICKNRGYDDVILNEWPTPVKKLNVTINSSVRDQGLISIYNLEGKLVTQESITIENGKNNYTVDIQNLSSDIYLVKISGNLFNTSRKITLE